MANIADITQGVAYLRGIDGSAEYTLLPAVGYTVGRMPSVAIPVRGASVSRLHAVIAGDGRRWMLTDHSSNGTLVNDRLISRHSLQHGDRIRFSEVSEFEFTLGETADTSTLTHVHQTVGLGHQDESVPLGSSSVAPLIIGTSKLTTALRTHITKAANSNRPVVIRGERGTGKRLVATSIHAQSELRRANCRVLNCNSLTASEIERLFAASKRETIVFQEILNLSHEGQTALFEALQSASRDRTEHSHRLISTMSRSPEEAIESSEFLADLFNRLAIVQILIDPLRDRPTEVPELATYFARMACQWAGGNVLSISDSAARILQEYDWPRNVTELRNVVERAVLFCDGSELEQKHLVAGFTAARQGNEPFEGMSLEEVERHHIQATLDSMKWVKLHVADVLGIERSTLDRKIKKYDLRRPDSLRRGGDEQGE